jgi:uncharacterized protein YcbX
MKLEQIIRYPVKGLGPDYANSTEVEVGGALPFDRQYAIALAATQFDAAAPEYLGKRNFLMLMKNPSLAALNTRFDEESRLITVSFPDGPDLSTRLDDPAEREQLETRLGQFVGEEASDGRPGIVSAQDHRFFDVPENYLSLINLESVKDLGNTVNAEIDPVRFRGNLHISGLAAWEEATLVGREFTCGDVRLRAASAIERCAATSVNPDTAERDLHVPMLLRKHYSTRDMGLYLEVIEGGCLETGARITLSPG